MITFHASAVCSVRDGYTGRPIEPSALLCTLDGVPCRPVGKPGGYLVLVNLQQGCHRLSFRGNGYQEEWVEFEAGEGTRELDITMKPGPGYPFRLSITRLTITLLDLAAPAVGRQLWLAAPAGPEIKIAQTKAEAGNAQARLFYKGAVPPAAPGTYLISDGKESEIVSLRTIEGEIGAFGAPLLRSHSRGKALLPAQSYHTNGQGQLMAVFREPCRVEICAGNGSLLESVELAQGENHRQITWKKEKEYG